MMLRVVAAGGTVPQGALLAPGIALVVLQGAGRGGAGLELSVRGRPPAPPFGTVDVGSDRSPARIAALRLPFAQEDSAPLLIEQDGEHVPLGISDLDGDPLAITAGLDLAARRRLLDFLLFFCCPGFRLGRSPAFARTCTRLALDCAENKGAAAAVAQVLPDHVLVEPILAGRGAALVVIGRDRVTQGRIPVLGSASGLQIIPCLEPGDLVVATGPSPSVWTVDVPPTLPHVLALSESGRVPSAAARAACREAFSMHRSDAAKRLLRDMDLLFPAQVCRITDPTQPVAGEVELAVPDSAGGIFLAGWLRDPLGAVESIAVATPAGRLLLAPGALERVSRPDIEKRFAAAAHGKTQRDGFVLHLPEMPGGDALQPRLALRLRSGAEVQLTPAARSLSPAAARDAILGCVPPGHLTPAIMRRCLAPAAARLHRAAMAPGGGGPELVEIGRTPAKPPVSLIVPLYRNLGFLRFQIAALAEDPFCRACELIFVLDSPEQRAETEHLLRGLHRLTEMPASLVVMPRNLGYAAATNAGARYAKAPLLLLLNSDVVPAGPGWLAALAAPFSRATVAAAGPKLLFADGSIQHAGLFFERDEDGIWFNRHYHKGMPRHWPDAAIRGRVPGVTGAALMVRRRLFERLGGICEDYIIGDYEDSDFCLRVREAGGTTLYVPEAELFHFERRSIRLHAGYARTHASLYNRLLHHGRWDAAMDAAMSGTVRVRGKAA